MNTFFHPQTMLQHVNTTTTTTPSKPLIELPTNLLEAFLPGYATISRILLACLFSLDVYSLSLAEPTISEEDLISLFDSLPSSCLVLLEDIDSARLVSRDSHSTESSQTEIFGSGSSRISLSGLLNVIDGVASQEGRVLIMTTNHLHSLDSALLRPGRVDVKIPFGLATKSHAENMFLQAFSEEFENKTGVGIKVLLDKEEKGIEEGKEGLKKIAKEFAERIPEGKFSPADIQGFLLRWKRCPEDAVGNVGDWVEEFMGKGGKSG